jgi:hypothetical protein
MHTLIKLLASLVILCALAATCSATVAQSQQPFFDFHNNFWVNLHHFLYQEALKQKRAQGAGAAAKVEGLSAEQLRAWQGALDYYQKEVVTRDLLFDDELVDVERRLSDSEKAATLKDAGIRTELASMLEAAAPVYRSRWWPEHERANQKWIAGVTPMIEKYGKAVTAELSTAYRTAWPTERIRVDVCTYANWAGAYTIIEPTLITISSMDERDQGYFGLEILFHESSHALMRDVRLALNAKFEAQKKPVPRDLWHALLFYTTGEIVRRALFAGGVKGYVPYAYANGLYTRGAWAQYLKPMEREWQPYVEGKADFDTALTRLVASL